LSINDTVEMTPENLPRGYWIVCGIASKGQLEFVHINDSGREVEENGRKKMIRRIYAPRIGGLLKKCQPKKVSVDPIGRVRPAND
jgi:hypothetical protein